MFKLVTFYFTGGRSAGAIREEKFPADGLSAAIIRGKNLAKFHGGTITMVFGDDLPVRFGSGRKVRKDRNSIRYREACRWLANPANVGKLSDYANAYRGEVRNALSAFIGTAAVAGSNGYREYRGGTIIPVARLDLLAVSASVNPGARLATETRVLSLADATQDIARGRYTGSQAERPAGLIGIGAE